MRSIVCLCCTLFQAAVVVAVAEYKTQSVYYPFQEFAGVTAVESVSQNGQKVNPKLHPGANETTFDWWYFDAVSTSSANQSITMIFLNTGTSGVPLPSFGGPLLFQVSGSFENGTTFGAAAPATEGALIEWSDAEIKADWKGTGGTFSGKKLNSDSPVFQVEVDSPTSDIHGSMTLQSISPPHLPCNNSDCEEVFPNVYWANMQPDAIATVNFTINGTRFDFQGVGYQGKNWGSEMTPKRVTSWYWGHGRLGPYSLVWLDVVTVDGKEHVSSWVTKDGQILSHSCEPDSVVVRPWGDNAEFPPPAGEGAPSGYTLTYKMGQTGYLRANFTTEAVTEDTPLYKRMLGSVSGGIDGGEQFVGRGLCEQFQFQPSKQS